jgi:hypothetical protein
MTIDFNIPTEPKDFSVDLPSSDLRSIDFSALDYEAARRTIIEYVRTYYPNDFNDFVTSNGFIILIDIISAVTDSLSMRNDLLANEAFLPSAQSEEAVDNHLQLIGQRLRRQTPATVEMEVSVASPSFTDIAIKAGQAVEFVASDGSSAQYEVFRGPGDWTGDIIIPAGKRGTVAWGVQGSFTGNFSETATGQPSQHYDFVDDDILLHPMFMTIDYNGAISDWKVVYEPIQKYGPNDRVAELRFFRDLSGSRIARLQFGDGVNGKSPSMGSVISLRYRTGGGTIGRIAAGVINVQKTVRDRDRSITVGFRNITNGVGGSDKETLREVKERAPKTYSLHGNLVTGSDYAHFANSFQHPHYGSIAKSSVVLLTSENRNIVDLHVLANGLDAPKAATPQLKEALKSAVSAINVMTDEVRVKDGRIKSVDLDCRVILDRNADARVTKNRVESQIKSFFSVDNFDIGQPLYISNLIEHIKLVDGVMYVDLITPNMNILSSRDLIGGDYKVAMDELITLGNSKVDYYYDTILGS